MFDFRLMSEDQRFKKKTEFITIHDNKEHDRNIRKGKENMICDYGFPKESTVLYETQ